LYKNISPFSVIPVVLLGIDRGDNMKKEIKILEIFKENNKYSGLRIAVYILLFGYMSDWFSHIVRLVEFKPSIELVVLIFSALGLKVWQKRIEVKNKG